MKIEIEWRKDRPIKQGHYPAVRLNAAAKPYESEAFWTGKEWHHEYTPVVAWREHYKLPEPTEDQRLRVLRTQRGGCINAFSNSVRALKGMNIDPAEILESINNEHNVNEEI